jgi:serine/threonine protein kinase
MTALAISSGSTRPKADISKTNNTSPLELQISQFSVIIPQNLSSEGTISRIELYPSSLFSVVRRSIVPRLKIFARSPSSQTTITNRVAPSYSLTEHLIQPGTSPTASKRESNKLSTPWKTEDFLAGTIIGNGTFSTIWQSQHLPSKKYFAIKEIDINKLGNVEKVTTAALLSIKLSHPFFINNYTFLPLPEQMTLPFSEQMTLPFSEQMTKDKRYLLMEHLSGIELYEYLSTSKPLEYSELQFLIGSILFLIKYLHERDVVHRDLKLENIFLTENGYPKILDVDFMKHLVKSDGRTSTFCGSPDYAAPEIVLAKKNYQGSCVDLWSIGVITYICFTLKMPFEYTTGGIQTLYRKIVHDEPNYQTSEFNGSKGDIVKGFIQNLLNKDPSSRFNVDEALSHPFLEKLNRESIESQREPSPFSINPDLPNFIAKP